jgi:HAD superfamily hydrolase (TIGR01509 family)|tara:strand:- start:61 stop:711 length:651 start_codon:yes stop_codon:yes gene_type:complete
MLKAIIFDMDGVLTDSIEGIWDSFEILLKEYGVNFSKEYIQKNLSRSLRDNLKAWKIEYGIKDYDIAEFSKRASEIQFDTIKNEKPDKHLIELLDQAKKYNIELAVATSSMKPRALEILEILQIKKYFKTIVTAEDIKNHKPNPEVFLEAAKRLKVDPEECIVIEDACSGVEAAKNAKMKAIGKVSDYTCMDDFLNADKVINKFSEINIDDLRELF